jgi:hypothetical protein
MTFIAERTVRVTGRTGVPAPHRLLGVTLVHVGARVIPRLRVLMASYAIKPVNVTPYIRCRLYLMLSRGVSANPHRDSRVYRTPLWQIQLRVQAVL